MFQFFHKHISDIPNSFYSSDFSHKKHRTQILKSNQIASVSLTLSKTYHYI